IETARRVAEGVIFREDQLQICGCDRLDARVLLDHPLIIEDQAGAEGIRVGRERTGPKNRQRKYVLPPLAARRRLHRDYRTRGRRRALEPRAASSSTNTSTSSASMRGASVRISSPERGRWCTTLIRTFSARSPIDWRSAIMGAAISRRTVCVDLHS